MQKLKERGENEQPRMVIRRRSGEKASEAMARSIVQLYLYAWSNIGTFPKQIISTASIEQKLYTEYGICIGQQGKRADIIECKLEK